MGEAEVVSLACASYPEIPDNCSLSRKPPEIQKCCLPADLREFARVFTGPKWPTEEPVLWSTIRQRENCIRGWVRGFGSLAFFAK